MQMFDASLLCVRSPTEDYVIPEIIYLLFGLLIIEHEKYKHKYMTQTHDTHKNKLLAY